MPASALRRQAKPLGGGLWASPAKRGASTFIYGTKRGRVSFTGVTTASIARHRAKLQSFVRRSHIR